MASGRIRPGWQSFSAIFFSNLGNELSGYGGFKHGLVWDNDS